MRLPALGRVLRGRGRRRIAAGVALLVAVAVVVVLALGAGSSSPKAAANSASGATTVQRRDLVQTDTESGTLSYANPQTVYDRLSGTITWLPSVGQVIKPGEALYKVDGESVLLMDGTTPAYRDLSPSDTSGQDILDLNRNLVHLGFNPEGIVIDNEWQAATTAGVDMLQASLGETETGSLSLGQVVFLPGDQLVSTVDATLGSTGGGSNQGNPGSSSNASDPVAASGPQFVGLTTGVATSPTTSTAAPATNAKPTKTKHRSAHHRTGTKTLRALIALLKAEIAELKAEKNRPSSNPSSPSSNPSSPKGSNPSSPKGGNPSSSNSGSPSSSSGTPSSSNSGGGGGSASAIIQTTSTHLIVTVDLDATKQSEAKLGEAVAVEMPNASTVNGKITAVSPVAQSSNNSNNGDNGSGNGNGNNNGSGGSSSTIPVTITLSGHQRAAGLDEAAVSVNFAEARANNVLSVPVTALLATAGGGYAVQEAVAPHKLIPVTTGLFAAGYVRISGAGIYPGLQVTDSQG
jgi:hypothetical protein